MMEKITVELDRGTTVVIGRYHTDTPYARKCWLRDAFLWQRQPLNDPTSPYHGCTLGMDTATVALRGQGVDPGIGVVVFITPELNAEFTAASAESPHQ